MLTNHFNQTKNILSAFINFLNEGAKILRQITFCYEKSFTPHQLNCILSHKIKFQKSPRKFLAKRKVTLKKSLGPAVHLMHLKTLVVMKTQNRTFAKKLLTSTSQQPIFFVSMALCTRKTHFVSLNYLHTASCVGQDFYFLMLRPQVSLTAKSGKNALLVDSTCNFPEYFDLMDTCGQSFQAVNKEVLFHLCSLCKCDEKNMQRNGSQTYCTIQEGEVQRAYLWSRNYCCCCCLYCSQCCEHLCKVCSSVVFIYSPAKHLAQGHLYTVASRVEGGPTQHYCQLTLWWASGLGLYFFPN